MFILSKFLPVACPKVPLSSLEWASLFVQRKLTMLSRVALWCLLPFVLIVGVTVAINAQEESQRIPNTQEEAIPFTPPHKALEAIELPDGFEVTLFAHEPDVHQPIAMTFDSKGRLWVVENYTYSDRKENFNNELFDRVVIFEDEDNDGKFDKRKIFWDKGNKLTGIELGRGGVWLMAAPEFIFIPDADRDDVPDGPPKVILDGFEDDEIRHNLVNGLRWGPDGWLYSRHGIQAVSHVGKPGSPISKRTPMNCCIWRYHPDQDIFEIVAEGGTNSWGFDFDKNGEMFFINTVIGHLFHVVPGARYNRMYGSHFNPYTWQTIDQTADHFHWGSNEKWFDAKKGVVGDNGTGSDATSKAGGGHAHCGFMIYQGDNWPDEFRGRAFTLNFHGRRINQEILVRDGSSFVGKHAPDMFQSADPWFRGVELTYGPDGAVYVLDWSDIGECHENDGIHRTSGRIFKISYGKARKPVYHDWESFGTGDLKILKLNDLNELSDKQLVDLNGYGNAWHSRMAQRILSDRVATGNKLSSEVIAQLLFRANSHHYFKQLEAQLESFWLMNSIGVCSEDYLLKRSRDSGEHIRSWAVRLLADGPMQSRNAINRMIEMAKDESSLVRLYVASAIQRLPAADAFKVATALSANEVDMQDRVQPKLIWHQIEPFIANDYDSAMALFGASRSQMLRRNIVRRLACDPERQDEMLDKLTSRMVLSGSSHDSIDIIHGIKAAVAGRTKMRAPQNWPFESAKDDTEWTKLIEEISPVFGSGLSLERLKKIANDKGAETDARQQAILSLSQFADPANLFPLLKRNINDRMVSTAVVKAMSVCQHDGVPGHILRVYPQLTDEGKRNGIDTLCGRKNWANKLLGAIEEGKIRSSALTAWHARQIQLFNDEALTDQLGKVWGKVRETDQERQAQIDELRELMKTDVPFDVTTGKKMFTTHCASCHAIFGEGGNTGPDLTGADRKNLNYLLENIVDPSASVATNFRASVLAMEDGRLLTGVVLDNDGQTLKLQTQKELLTLEVSAVEEIKQTELSLMPEKLLDQLSDNEKIQLFKYLMSK